jgi:arylsulfatase A-like enzyme
MELNKKKPLSPWRGILLGLLILAVIAAVWFFRSSTFSPTKPRRVILISIDTCRADYLSCYGFGRKTTPNIDALANESILFENVVTPSPLTLPAHSTMLTGTIPPYHGVRMNQNYRLGDSNLTIAEILRKNGYKTGAVIGTSVLESKFGISQGFENYNDRFLGKREPGFEHRRRAAEVSNLAVKWLAENANEDFFLFLHYFDPHAQYILPIPIIVLVRS